MTTLHDIFQLLSAGELSQVKIGNQGKGILPNDQPGLLSHINLGLAALYKRFSIKKGEVYIELTPGQSVYALKKGSTFILSPDFEGDINKIEQVFTDKNVEVPINDRSTPYNVSVVSQDTIRLSTLMALQGADTQWKYKTSILRVEYRAKHMPIEMAHCEPGAFFEPSEIELNIPDMYLEALTYFVASRVMNPIGLGQEFYAGDNYSAKFEAECLRLETLGLQLEPDDFDRRFVDRGFV